MRGLSCSSLAAAAVERGRVTTAVLQGVSMRTQKDRRVSRIRSGGQEPQRITASVNP
jgi:hypothetical protein